MPDTFEAVLDLESRVSPAPTQVKKSDFQAESTKISVPYLFQKRYRIQIFKKI